MCNAFIPDGYHTITPNTIVRDAEKAIEFYKRALGAKEIVRLTMPDGTVVHAELGIGDSHFALGEAMEGWAIHPLLAQIFVEDADILFRQAVDAGSKILMPMTDMPFGIREGRVVDPFNNTWIICTRKEALSPEEMQRRIDESAS